MDKQAAFWGMLLLVDPFHDTDRLHFKVSLCTVKTSLAVPGVSWQIEASLQSIMQYKEALVEIKETQAPTVSLSAQMRPQCFIIPVPLNSQAQLARRSYTFNKSCKLAYLQSAAEMVLSWLNCVCHLVATPCSRTSPSGAQGRGLPVPQGAWKVLAEQMRLAFVSKENPKVGFKKSPRQCHNCSFCSESDHGYTVQLSLGKIWE